MNTIEITNENFQKEVTESEKPVLIDFWASWCAPCKILSPVVDQIAQERLDIKVCKINIDEQPDLASTYKVMSIPTLMFMKHGKVAGSTVGAQPKRTILAMIDRD